MHNVKSMKLCFYRQKNGPMNQENCILVILQSKVPQMKNWYFSGIGMYTSLRL